ncbi:SET domain-containing protein 4 isoform X2 [Rhinichthys klamathensis goyatoka]|uniref:SET domain-containing protein 4 isoform X2 n=1 Tax=Rhinichthys klamathensis goyatoka TaxID=3034132 RepID=UPI0024B5EE5D|nr:SET domain-containing protein 4 isoform X2 [Rhinichthys klamathensis goyatoka]
MNKSGCRTGRRARKKRRKKHESHVSKVTLTHEAQFVLLRRWLKERGFTSQSLIPVNFHDTGRGLMATQTIKAKDMVISLPEKYLLTSSTVMKSYMGDYIKRWHPPISPLLALCCFLIAERHRGDASEWSPYINILPKTYTCPVYLSDDIIGLLPKTLQKKATEQKEQCQELCCSSLMFFNSLQPLFNQPTEELFTQDAMRWAWCSVNTRTVYMEHDRSNYLSSEKDVYALAPYLDLLNHCPNVQVEAGFNKDTCCYEVKSVQGCKKFQQAFINYGPHDNHRLLLEYGFVAPGNPHSVVYVDLGTLKLCLNERDKQLTQKLLYLKDNAFLRNLTFGMDGPSWRLMTALRLLSLTPEQYSWKSVLLGAGVSRDREEWCIQSALKLCNNLTDGNVKALERLSQLKQGANLSRLEQLCVVESLRLEEQRILEHTQVVLQNLLRQ